MSQSKVPLALACLALFDRTTAASIIDYCRSNSTGSILADLDRSSNPYLPPGIFALASPRYALTEDNAYYVLLGLVHALIYRTQSEEFGKAEWQSMLEELFMISGTYAGTLADRIETADIQEDISDRIMARISSTWNALAPDAFGLDVNVGDPKFDVDLSYEFLTAGKVIKDLLTRNAMITTRVEEAVNPALPPRIKGLLTQLNQPGEGGDLMISTMPQIAAEIAAAARPLPIPRAEQGPLQPYGDVLSGIGQALGNFLRTPSGQQLAQAGVNAAAGLAARALGGGRAATAAPAPATQPIATSPSATVTPAALGGYGDDVSRATGGILSVRLG